ncbi:MAG: hypothetical protein JW847_05520 [Candidatus Omnitrophica bacterium]|nr:hypothetical protein [Candidatus Omnitrophota bacterium]
MNMKEKERVVSQAGQSLIEYILLVAIVTAILIAFFRPGGYFQQVFLNVADQETSYVLNTAEMIFH